MSDNQPTDGRATIALVYRLVGELRTEMTEQIGRLDARMEARFDGLMDAISSIRDGVVSCGVCDERHRGVTEILGLSAKDRQDIWTHMDSMESRYASKLTERLVYGLVGTTLLAVIGAVLALVVN